MNASAAQPTVVAIVGSPRAAGNTAFLVDVALGELERHGVSCQKIVLAEHKVFPCEGHDDCESRPVCPVDDEAQAIIDKMYAADGVILASPVYYEDVTGQMKVFIDRNCFNYTHEHLLEATAVGLIAVAESTGLHETIDTLKRFVSLQSNGKIKPLVVTGFAYREGDAAGNGDLVADAKRMAHELAAALTRDFD